jgi:hypothetical protein
MRLALAALAGALLALAGPSLAASKPDPYRALQQRDQKLFAVGWRLVTGNAQFCDHTVPAIGILLHDLQSYPDPAAARADYGATGDISVQAVAAGSPAAQRKVPVGASLTVIGRSDTAAAFPMTEPRWQRLRTIEQAIEQDLTRQGMIELAWDEPGGAFAFARIPSVPACATRFEVSGIGERAAADGARVVFGDAFPGFGWPDDQFASAVAHELAHNLLGHRAWLDRVGRSRAKVRMTEEEADRLAPWLLANAAYDPAAAVAFMRAWGPRHDGGLFRKRTHSGWDERAAAIAAELPLIERARDANGKADWRRKFRRTTGG